MLMRTVLSLSRISHFLRQRARTARTYGSEGQLRSRFMSASSAGSAARDAHAAANAPWEGLRDHAWATTVATMQVKTPQDWRRERSSLLGELRAFAELMRRAPFQNS